MCVPRHPSLMFLASFGGGHGVITCSVPSDETVSKRRHGPFYHEQTQSAPSHTIVVSGPFQNVSSTGGS